MWGRLLSLKRHLFPNGSRVKLTDLRLFDLFFDAASHLEYVPIFK